MKNTVAILIVALLLTVSFLIGWNLSEPNCNWNEEYYNPNGCTHIDYLQ